MAKVPYLAYLQNLRQAPDKYSAQKASPTGGIVSRPLNKADLDVYRASPEDITKQLIRDISMDEETMMAIQESRRSNKVLQDDQGNYVSLTEALESYEDTEAPSGGLMSPPKEGEETAPEVDTDLEEAPATVPTGDYAEDPELSAFSDTISILQDNTEFMSEVNRLTSKYPGLTEREIFMVASKESSLLTNPKADNMFEIKSVAAKDMNAKGYTIDLKKLNASKNPTDHIKALEKYLDRWDYDGKAPLGLVIAAPGYRNASPDTVVYTKGSKEIKANPKWAGPDGNATVASITKFYRGQ
jgi:hypothetical protein